MSLENLPEHVLDLPITFPTWENDPLVAHELPRVLPTESIIFVDKTVTTPEEAKPIPISE